MDTQDAASGRHGLQHGYKLFFAAVLMLFTAASYGEVCTTQSQMKPADRDSIGSAARALALKVQANDAPGLRQQSIAEFAKDFTAMNSLVASTAAKIAATPLMVEQIYLLDATNLKTLADGTNQDAQFFCSLNNSIAEATFLIPALPPGRYAFAQVVAQGSKSPWGLSFLLCQSTASQWSLAGFYPKALTGAGHDGLWYWTQAREQVKAKHLWTAYLYYQEAQALLQPVGFVSSTHLEKLRKEAASAAPPALSEGINTETPLVIKGPAGKGQAESEIRVTNLTTDDSVGGDKLYVVLHLAPDAEPDPLPAGAANGGKKASKAESGAAPAVIAPAIAPPVASKERNANAMTAVLAAYPELRASFGGVWVFADSPGRSPFVTEQAMADIH